ncbi:MAG: hypothetical protein L3J35_07995 [Bacteroidales bacterium]|nr:hypothetical protein [Bacteroidales bacterium]
MKQIFTLSIIAILFLTSCESVEDAQLAADDFFEAFNTENEAKMESILDKESVIDAGLKGTFYDVFDQHARAFGKVNSYSRYGFATNTKNGVTTVLLKFKCETEKGKTVYEKLNFVKRGDGYKVFQYEYNIDQAVIDKVED